MTIQRKIVSIIVMMLFLMTLISFVAYKGLTDILNVTEWSIQTMKLDKAMSSAEQQTDKYLLSIYSNDKKLGEASIEEVHRKLGPFPYKNIPAMMLAFQNISGNIR